MANLTLPFSDLSGLIVASAVLVLLGYMWKRKEGPFPPGPKPHWLIGNALDIPFDKGAKTYLEWSKQYNSTVIHLYALGTRIVVLNSKEDTEELLEKRAEIYSDRPAFPTLDVLGWDYIFSVFNYNDYYRSHRRIAHQHLKTSALPQYYPIIIRKTHDMLAGLLDTPERFEDHNKMLSLSIPLTTMYGYEVTSLDDPVIVAADRSLELGVKVVSPGGSLANIIPAIKYIPWTWTQRIGKEVRRLSEEVKRIPLEALLKNMAEGKAIPSLVGNFMEKKQTAGVTDPKEEQIILNVANTVYAAGSDTTVSATKTFFYQLTSHPDIQLKAQEELDRVLGSPPDRLPTFEDMPMLPFVEAIYQEVLRWYPPGPLGVPHASSADDWYKGYLIPKGTFIMANIWGINRDEELYGPDAYEFNPGRFIDQHGRLKEDRVLAYGFGRRNCVGRHVAKSTLWLMMASVLACFNLRKKKDIHGNEIEINDEYDEEGLLGHKRPFECDITPRSEEWRQLIDATRNQGYKF